MIEYRPLAFVSPSGRRTEFVYDGALSDTITHFTSSFKFVGVDGSYHQDRSIDSGSYPFLVYLTGDDRVERLKELRDDLNEKSEPKTRARLEHPDPTLGTFDCVVSSYSVSSNLVKNINTIIVSMSFSRTINELTDGGIDFSTQEIFSKNISSFEQFADDFKNTIDKNGGAAVSALANDTIKMINIANDTFSSITAEVEEASIAFDDVSSELLQSIDTFVRSPEVLAASMQNLITLPVLFTSNLSERVNAYNSMLELALDFSVDQLKDIENATSVGKNFLANKVMVTNAVISGLVQIYTQTPSTTIDELKRGTASGFSTREEIQGAIDNILAAVEAVSIIISDKSKNFSNINFFKQYFDTSLLIKPFIKSAILNLQNRLTVLPVGRQAYLPYDEHTVVLCSAIYGSVETDVLQFFYNSNNIHGDEMYLLKKGRAITWFGESIFEKSLDPYLPIVVEPELDIWQDTPFNSGNEQIQDIPFIGTVDMVQDIPIE